MEEAMQEKKQKIVKLRREEEKKLSSFDDNQLKKTNEIMLNNDWIWHSHNIRTHNHVAYNSFLQHFDFKQQRQPSEKKFENSFSIHVRAFFIFLSSRSLFTILPNNVRENKCGGSCSSNEKVVE